MSAKSRKEKSSVPTNDVTAAKPDALLDRVVSILEEARGNVVRAVNTNMVFAYRLIGREIVEPFFKSVCLSFVSGTSADILPMKKESKVLLNKILGETKA